MSEQALPSTSSFVEAMDDVNKAQKLNPKADQLLVEMGIKEDDTVPTCTITQEKIDYKDCVKTSCGHYFSREEFWEWTKQSNKCPNCREELIQRDRGEELALKNLLDRRREIREQVRDAYEEYDNVNEKIILRNRVLKGKHAELRELKEEEKEAREVNEIIENSIQCNEEILEEMRLYKSNRSQWEKRMKRRERLAIHRGKDKWRKNIKEVHKQIHVNEMLRQGFRLREIGWFVPREEEVDISKTNMFNADETTYTTPGGVEDRVIRVYTEQEVEEGEIVEDYSDEALFGAENIREATWSDMSLDTDYDDMPELIDAPGTPPGTPPRTPPNQMIPTWRNRNLNPEQFREFLNAIQPINIIETINRRGDISTQRTLLSLINDIDRTALPPTDD